MNPLASLSPSGRLARGPFMLLVVVIYVLSFLSQTLLSAAVTSSVGLMPFALVQAALIWVWFIVHSKRLHDARRGVGTAVGLVIVYALGIVLLLLVMVVVTGSESDTTTVRDGAGLLHLFAFIALLGLFSSDTGAFGLWVVFFFALCLVPSMISFGFSIWAGTRPTTFPVRPDETGATA